LKINVTAEDIRAGVSGESDACPIARAALRALTEAGEYVNVSAVRAALHVQHLDATGKTRDWRCFGLPPEAAAFVDAFDAGSPVEPFTFEVS